MTFYQKHKQGFKLKKQVLTKVSSIVWRLFSKKYKEHGLVFLWLQFWLIINSHRENRAHGFELKFTSNCLMILQLFSLQYSKDVLLLKHEPVPKFFNYNLTNSY